jgi:hypothetical protein
VIPTSFPAAAAACGLDPRQTMLPGLRGARALNRHRLAGAPSGCANGMLGCRCHRSPRPGAAVSQVLGHLPGDLGSDFCVGVTRHWLWSARCHPSGQSLGPNCSARRRHLCEHRACPGLLDTTGAWIAIVTAGEHMTRSHPDISVHNAEYLPVLPSVRTRVPMLRTSSYGRQV